MWVPPYQRCLYSVHHEVLCFLTKLIVSAHDIAATVSGFLICLETGNGIQRTLTRRHAMSSRVVMRVQSGASPRRLLWSITSVRNVRPLRARTHGGRKHSGLCSGFFGVPLQVRHHHTCCRKHIPFRSQRCAAQTHNVYHHHNALWVLSGGLGRIPSMFQHTLFVDHARQAACERTCVRGELLHIVLTHRLGFQPNQRK